MATTLNSEINLAINSTPDITNGMDSNEVYEALLRVHNAIEILVRFYDTNAGLYVTLAEIQSITGAKTFDAVSIFNALVTLGDGIDLALNTTTGSKIGTAVSQKLGFWNATPIVQPAAANQAALTNSTGGTRDGVLSNVTGAGSLAAAADGATTNNNFTDIYALLTEMRTAMVASGLMKGSA